MFKLESNPYLEEAIQSPNHTGQKSRILPNCSVIISSQSTEDTIPDMELGTTQYVCCFVCSRLCRTHFSDQWRKMCNISCQLTHISKRQRDPCINYNFNQNAAYTLQVYNFHRFLVLPLPDTIPPPPLVHKKVRVVYWNHHVHLSGLFSRRYVLNCWTFHY